MESNSLFLFLAALVIVVPESIRASQSHVETYTYYTTISRQSCVVGSSRSCGGWWIFKSCSSSYFYQCAVVYERVPVQAQKCQTGWTSAACNVPICNTACIDGKVCTAPDTCSCITTGGGCSSVPCDANNNCYPGSCSADGATCTCPSGFSGTNCLTIEKTPNITSCTIQLYNTSQTLFKTMTCGYPWSDPNATTWIGNPISKIEVTWTAEDQQPFSLPPRDFASYVANSPVPIGVASTGFSVSNSITGSPGVYTNCPNANGQSPQSTVNCDVNYAASGVQQTDNQLLRVDVTASLGGHKDGANSPTISGSNFPPQQFTGTQTSRRSLFRFDLVPPVHCLSFYSGSSPQQQCPVFPIYLDNDITTSQTIQPKFYNWSDASSGVSNFHVEVYFMQPNVNNLLVNAQGAVTTSDVDPNKNNFVFTCTQPGVYSIELTVYDQAGNSAKARKLFIFTNKKDLKEDPSQPVFIREADPNTGYTWITKFDDPRNGGYIPLTLVWTGHFSSDAKFDSAWSLAAQSWDSSIGIDDQYQNIYGARSIYAITNMPNGIFSYGVSFIVDQTGGGKGLVPDSWIWLNATANTYSLPISSLTDGSTIVVWLQCYDVTGGNATVKRVVSVDRSAPSVTNATFTPNAVDDSTSQLSIFVADKASGIQVIHFSIYDSTLKTVVRTDSSLPQKRDSPTPSAGQNKRKKRIVSACTPSDTTCYCIPSGSCFNYAQTIQIDNCWLDHLSGHSFEFRFTVTNGANSTSSEQSISVGVLTLKCRVSQVPVAGIVIGCILGFLVLIVLIVVMVLLIRIYILKKPVPERLRRVHQTIRNRWSDTPKHDENIAYSSGPFATSRDNHSYVRETNTSLESVSKPSKSNNQRCEYEYAFKASEQNHKKDSRIFTKHQLQIGKVITNGRFAVIKMAKLTDGNEQITVATKGLPSGSSATDADLFADKVALLSNVPAHENIVKYLGKYEDVDEHGTIMVMEFCDMSLKDWLIKKKEMSELNSEVLEEMLNFTLSIAKGVKHLHENKIIHRRLGTRNVLLKKQYGGYVAKLIGFGPNREDQEGAQSSLPLKWFAPETLETLNNNSPTYNNKTDAWSYAITVWEIYSTGDLPYPNMDKDEVIKALTREKRMALRRPDDCPEELFQNVVAPCWNFTPKRRPSFVDICARIETFHRGGSGLNDGVYYTGRGNMKDNDDPPPLYDDAC